MILAVAIKLVTLSGVTQGVILPNAAAPILALPTFPLFYLISILFFYLFYFYFLSFFKFLFPLFFNV